MAAGGEAGLCSPTLAQSNPTPQDPSLSLVPAPLHRIVGRNSLCTGRVEAPAGSSASTGPTASPPLPHGALLGPPPAFLAVSHTVPTSGLFSGCTFWLEHPDRLEKIQTWSARPRPFKTFLPPGSTHSLKGCHRRPAGGGAVPRGLGAAPAMRGTRPAPAQTRILPASAMSDATACPGSGAPGATRAQGLSPVLPHAAVTACAPLSEQRPLPVQCNSAGRAVLFAPSVHGVVPARRLLERTLGNPSDKYLPSSCCCTVCLVLGTKHRAG